MNSCYTAIKCFLFRELCDARTIFFVPFPQTVSPLWEQLFPQGIFYGNRTNIARFNGIVILSFQNCVAATC